jgi:hypothetical protein
MARRHGSGVGAPATVVATTTGVVGRSVAIIAPIVSPATTAEEAEVCGDRCIPVAVTRIVAIASQQGSGIIIIHTGIGGGRINSASHRHPIRVNDTGREGKSAGCGTGEEAEFVFHGGCTDCDTSETIQTIYSKPRKKAKAA